MRIQLLYKGFKFNLFQNVQINQETNFAYYLKKIKKIEFSEKLKQIYQLIKIQSLYTQSKINKYSMQAFRPSYISNKKSNKYHSERKINPESSNSSVFILPREIIQKRQSYLTQGKQKVSKQTLYKPRCTKTNSFRIDYQQHLRKTAYSHSKQQLHKKSQKKFDYSLQSAKMLNYPMYNHQNDLQKLSQIRKYSQSNTANANRAIMASKTWNILYNTIVDSQSRRKSKPLFEINTKKLPVIQKLSEQTRQKGYEKLKLLSQKYSLNRNNSHNNQNNQNRINSIEKQILSNSQIHNRTLSQQLHHNIPLINRETRLKQKKLNKIKQNEIQPWNNNSQNNNLQQQQQWFY